MLNILNRIAVCLAVFIVVTVCFTACEANSENTKFHEMIDEIMQSVKNNDHKETLRLLNIVIDDDPSSYDALVLRCQTYLQTGNVQLAINDIDSALRLKKDDSMMLYRCIIKESQAKNEDEAIQCYANIAENMHNYYPEEYIKQSKEYVMISILGKFHDYETIRQKYIDQLQKNDERRKSKESEIRNFSRLTVLPIIKSIRDAQEKSNKIYNK